MSQLDLLALFERLGEINTRLKGQDRFMETLDGKLDKVSTDVAAVRHDHANSKHTIGLLAERVETLQAKQTSTDGKVSGLNEKIATMLGTAAALKWFVNWGPVTAAATLTLTLCREWLMGLFSKLS